MSFWIVSVQCSIYSIIHRAGSVPLSIAGIFKEVTTITISAWVFGDQLTQLNIVGVFVTVCGIATFTYHKYQKSISEPLPLDSHGKPVDPENGGEPHLYSRAPQSHEETRLAPDHSPGIYTETDAVPLSSLEPRRVEAESEEERVNRLRDNFEGWDNREDRDWSDEESEADLGEVDARRKQREGDREDQSATRSWGRWWDQSM